MTEEGDALDIRLLFLNTYLMDIKADDIIGDASRGTKPYVDERAKEIGSFVRQYTDLAALCEVWTTEQKDKLLGRFARPPEHVHHIKDFVAVDSWLEGFRREEHRHGSSGLITLSTALDIVEHAFREFEAESGVDEKADKGALMATFDPGLGRSRLQIYNTHLQAGDRFVALQQTLELAKFILETRRERDVAIVAGDFNIAADDVEEHPTEKLVNTDGLPDLLRDAVTRDAASSGTKTAYCILRDVFGALGFYDLWATKGEGPGYTSGMTTDEVAKKICRPDPSNPRYCHDDVGEQVASERIDYIFVSNPLDGQSLRAEVGQPRRVRLERKEGLPGRNEIAFFSDHVGLMTTLRLSPA